MATERRDRLDKVDLSRGCVMVANHPRGILDVFSTGSWFSANSELPVKCIGNRAIGRFVPAPEALCGRSQQHGHTGPRAPCLQSGGLRGSQGFSPRTWDSGRLSCGRGGLLSLPQPRRLVQAHRHSWNPSFVRIARELELPIVPIHISGRNRTVYYVLRFFGRIFGRLANFRELVASRKQSVVITVGQALTAEDYSGLSDGEVADRIRANLFDARN